jgi:predicted MFS family arabinose efflux permease
MLLCGLMPAYWPVFVGLVVASFGKTIFDPAIQAFIGRNVPFAGRGRVIGAVETAWAGSTLVGIPALGLIIERLGLNSSFYLMALLGAIGWLLISRVIPPDEPNPHPEKKKAALGASLKQLVQIRPAAGMLAFGFWISIANDSLFVVYGAWFEQDFLVSLVALGFSTVAIGAAELLGESLTALFADRLGLKRAVILGLGLAIGAYLLLPLIGRTLGPGDDDVRFLCHRRHRPDDWCSCRRHSLALWWNRSRGLEFGRSYLYWPVVVCLGFAWLATGFISF